MKIRSGFVTNSSSTSFVLFFEEKIETVDQLRRLMFGDIEKIKHPFDNCYVKTKYIAEIVFNDIKDQQSKYKRLTNKQINNISLSGLYNKAHIQIWSVYTRYYSSSHEEVMLEYYKLQEKLVEKYKKKYIYNLKNNKKKYYKYKVEYSDNDSDGDLLEHGGIFDNVKHTSTSHH